MTIETRETREQQDVAVVSWRRDQLVRAGYSLPEARRLARDPRYDLHALLQLVDRGCPPALAVRILAPLDEATAA